MDSNTETRKNIALIGFMATGKSTVGKKLAEKLNMAFIETDLEIEKRTGKTIHEIFEQEGETSFREKEIQGIKEVSKKDSTVISSGGGVVLNKINIDMLRKSSIIILLKASIVTITERVTGDDKRPLLNHPDKKEKIRQLLEFRKPFYERSADITIITDDKSIEQICVEIREKVDEFQRISSDKVIHSISEKDDKKQLNNEQHSNNKLSLADIRKRIDYYDKQLIDLAAKRQSLIPSVAAYKKENNIPRFIPEREDAIIRKIRNFADEQGLDPELAEDMMKSIIKNSHKIEKKIIGK